MDVEMLEILLVQIPEAIYFALFMIYTKQLKEKRILFIVLMIFEYLLLKIIFPFNMKFQLSYTIVVFIILKILYKEKSQITDIFTFAISSIILMLCCIIPSFLIINEICDYIIYAITTRILMFGFLFLFRNKLNKIQQIYKKIWNRNDKVKKKIKTTTFRSFNIVLFNIMFYIINIGMIYALYFNSK